MGALVVMVVPSYRNRTRNVSFKCNPWIDREMLEMKMVQGWLCRRQCFLWISYFGKVMGVLHFWNILNDPIRLFSVTRRSRSDSRPSLTNWLSVSTDLTDVTLVSDDTYWRLDWCYPSNRGCWWWSVRVFFGPILSRLTEVTLVSDDTYWRLDWCYFSI